MTPDTAGSGAARRPGRTLRLEVGAGSRKADVALWKGLQRGTACVVRQLEREIGGYRAALERIRDLGPSEESRAIAEAALAREASAT